MSLTELLKKDCLPVLLYGTEACPLKKSQFVVNSCFAKKILTQGLQVINCCQLIYIYYDAI